MATLFIRKSALSPRLRELRDMPESLRTDTIYSAPLKRGKRIRFKPYYRRTVGGELRIFAMEVPNGKNRR